MKQTRVHSATLVFLLIGSVFLVATACGSLGDIFGGQDNLPIAGVTPWAKIDFYSDIELAQPFVLISGEDTEYIEPCLLETQGLYWMYFEAMKFETVNGDTVHTVSAVYLAQSRSAFDWEIVNDGLPVFTAEEPWEEGFVGAPSVVATSSGFVMYYGGGRGAGIGRATSEDGLTWTRDEANPLIVPDQQWEGGAYGQVMSPSVAVRNGRVRLWYAGGQAGHGALDRLMGRAIGYATSEDGIAFVKEDGWGRTSETHPGQVEPVFLAEKEWEGYDPESRETGAVGMPGVFVDRTDHRTVYRMYYSGHRIGDMYSDNVSIGYGGSFDGTAFSRPLDILNPVVTEKFALTVWGVSNLLDYDEFGASVIRLKDDRYLMAFTQIDAMNYLGYGLKGIAMASCPPL